MRSHLILAAALATTAMFAEAPDRVRPALRSSGPKNGKTKRRATQKLAKKAKQRARKL